MGGLHTHLGEHVNVKVPPLKQFVQNLNTYLLRDYYQAKSKYKRAKKTVQNDSYYLFLLKACGKQTRRALRQKTGAEWS